MDNIVLIEEVEIYKGVVFFYYMKFNRQKSIAAVDTKDGPTQLALYKWLKKLPVTKNSKTWGEALQSLVGHTIELAA